MGYYADYGGDANIDETVQAINDAADTAANIGATWADYSGKKADRELRYKMWREQLEWNSPKNQLQRLRDAGLTPFGAPVSNGNMDSLPEIGANPNEAIANGLYRFADAAVKRISSYTAIQDAKNRALQARNEYERLRMQQDIAPIQRRFLSNQVHNMELVNEFLSSSMQDRLDDAYNSAKLKGFEKTIKGWYSQWMAQDGNGDSYYQELFEALQNRNAYTKWLIDHGNELFEYQKERNNIADTQWNIMNNPFGIGIGSGSINSLNGILNTIFQFIRFFAGQ